MFLIRLEKLNYRAINSSYMVGALAQRLKSFETITPPSWAGFAKTAVFKQSLPQDPNWWYNRAASVLIKLSKNPALGTNKLSKEYGGRAISTSKPHHAVKSSRKIIRTIVDQLEESNIIKTEGSNKLITADGEKLLNEVGKQVIEQIKQEEPRLAIYDWNF